MIGVLAVLLMIFLVSHALLVGVAVGEGFFLHWLLPGLDVSTVMVIALIATIASVYFVARLMGFLAAFDFEEAEEDEEGDLPPRALLAPLPKFGRRRRKRKEGP